MKDRKRNAIMASVMLAVVAALLCITASLAWYTTVITNDVPLQLEANGMVVVDLSAAIELDPQDGRLSPAVENPDPAYNPIVNNTAMDVLTESATIVRAATPVTYATEISVWLGKLDPDKTPVPQTLHMGLTATLTAANGDRWAIGADDLNSIIGYTLGVQSAKIPDADEEAPWPTPVADGYTAVTDLTAPVYTLTENSVVFVQLTVWLSMPQGLLDPALAGGTLTLHLNVRAEDSSTALSAITP